jgi:hypothetical protein
MTVKEREREKAAQSMAFFKICEQLQTHIHIELR